MAELHGLWQLHRAPGQRAHQQSWGLTCHSSDLQLISTNVQNKIKNPDLILCSCALPLHPVGLQKKNGQQLQGRQISATVTPAACSVSPAAALQPPLLWNWVLQAAACPAG